MFCPNCGNELIQQTRFCPHCGKKRQRKNNVIILVLLFSVLLSGSLFGVTYFFSDDTNTPAESRIAEPAPYRETIDEKIKIVSIPTTERRPLEEEQKRELTEVIADAQESVYTIFTDDSQGSGFLYNSEGAVITNAHVVEGKLYANVKTVDGTEYQGSVIGYSNETDVAVIHVPELIGETPFPVEVQEASQVGEEVIALGSPLGLENTATMGYITGAERNFVIDNFVYEELYQISAPISPGSSGGPLLSKKTEHIIAINSAQNVEDTSIGFSIPIYKVNNLIQSWISNPMTEEELIAQFYDGNGQYYYGDSRSNQDEGYFDGGYYSEEDDYYDYWEYDYDDFWDEYGDELWDYYMEEEFYDDEYYYDDDEYYYDDDDYYYDDEYDYDDEYYEGENSDWYDEEDYSEDEYYEYYDDEYYYEEDYSSEYNHWFHGE